MIQFQAGNSIGAVRAKEVGMTALIAVIFAAILLSIITISFTAIMVREQTAANDDEQSQSAYDSAMTGVEDAKRAIARCSGGDSNACNAINSGSCKTIQAAGVAGSTSDDEVVIESSTTSGAELNQAYTCVKIQMNTDDYIEKIQKERSDLVPLKGVTSVAKVRVEWQRQDDDAVDSPVPSVPGADCHAGLSLCRVSNWGRFPALLRAQAITPGSSFTLTDLDKNENGGTVFLYPQRGTDAVPLPDIELDRYPRYAENSDTDDGFQVNSPKAAKCFAPNPWVGFLCRSVIKLPRQVDARSTTAFLRITPIYKTATVKVTLLDASNNIVQFDGVQPVVDSTGRANDLFRRVSARLSLSSNLQLPENAVDIGGSLCKNFSVTDDPANASSIGEECIP